MRENAIQLKLCRPSIADETSAIQALKTLPELEKAQSQIEQLTLEILENCTQFFKCYPVEVVRFTKSASNIDEAIQISSQKEDQSEEPSLERQTMVIALPIQWHQNSATLKDMIPQRVIFYQITEENPDKTAVITVARNNEEAFIMGTDLKPGFGLGFDKEAAKSDLRCQFQFRTSNNLIENL